MQVASNRKLVCFKSEPVSIFFHLPWEGTWVSFYEKQPPHCTMCTLYSMYKLRHILKLVFWYHLTYICPNLRDKHEKKLRFPGFFPPILCAAPKIMFPVPENERNEKWIIFFPWETGFWISISGNRAIVLYKCTMYTLCIVEKLLLTSIRTIEISSTGAGFLLLPSFFGNFSVMGGVYMDGKPVYR